MPNRTPTETMIAVMEDMGTSEAVECLVIYSNSDGQICWDCSHERPSIILGLMEMCKQIIISDVQRWQDHDRQDEG